VLVWVGLAVIAWSLLPGDWHLLGVPPHVWRTVLLVWIVGLSFLVKASLLGHLGRVRMTRAEALILLQDAVWRDTRREQRRINRWLVWARLRGERRKERE
jgi:hypothetical protein